MAMRIGQVRINKDAHSEQWAWHTMVAQLARCRPHDLSLLIRVAASFFAGAKIGVELFGRADGFQPTNELAIVSIRIPPGRAGLEIAVGHLRGSSIACGLRDSELTFQNISGNRHKSPGA